MVKLISYVLFSKQDTQVKVILFGLFRFVLFLVLGIGFLGYIPAKLYLFISVNFFSEPEIPMFVAWRTALFIVVSFIAFIGLTGIILEFIYKVIIRLGGGE